MWAVSADGATAVSGVGGRVSVWDLRAGKAVGQLAESGAAVTALAVADDGTWMVAADEAGGLQVWDLKSRASAPRAAARPIRHPVASITVFAGEHRVLCATRYGDLEAWDLRGSTQLIRRGEDPNPDYAVRSLAVSPDGQRAAFGSFDNRGPNPRHLGMVTVVDLANGQDNATLPGGCTSVAFLPGGRTLGGARSSELMEWELESGRVLVDCTLEGDWRGTIVTDTAYAFSADGGRVAGWRLEPTSGHSAAVTGVACSEQATRAASVSRDDTLRIWELVDERSSRTLGPEKFSGLGKDQKLCVALSADGTRAVTGSYTWHLAVWDLDTGECTILVPRYPGSGGNPRPAIRWVRAVAISADGSRAVSASGYADDLIVWDLDNATELGRVPGIEVSHLAMTPDLRYGISNGPAWWDMSANRCTPLPEAVTYYTGQAIQVTAVAVTADGTSAAAGYADGTVQWWDTSDTPSLAGRAAAHAMGVHGLAFIARGTRLVSASGDRTMAIWDAGTGRELGRAAFPAPLRCLGVSGAYVAVGDAAGGLHYCQWHDFADP